MKHTRISYKLICIVLCAAMLVPLTGCGETRETQRELIQNGASPRATLALNLAARGNALLRGRPYATPQDVKEVVHDVLRHRILLTYEAEAEGLTSDKMIDKILDQVPVP